MNPREFLAKQKIHLIFGGFFLFALALNFTIAFTTGETFLGATWRAISEIRPMEYLMFGLFWYGFAVHRRKDEWDSSFISLNLGRSTNQSPRGIPKQSS